MDFIFGYLAGSRDAAMNRVAASSMTQPTPETRMITLDERIDRLTMIVQAMWAVLEDQGISEDVLAAKIAELDELDGVADGKLSRPSFECRHCGAAVPAARATCQFCGNEVNEPDPFSQV